eukprot:scaffold178_cov255-Pinguiococcus_pyrenoidosus.AAC.3
MSLPEEVLAQYASFIKTLGLRLDAATVQFFFDHRARRFGIFGKVSKQMRLSREAHRAKEAWPGTGYAADGGVAGAHDSDGRPHDHSDDRSHRG